MPPNTRLFSITHFLYGWQKIFTNKNIFSKHDLHVWFILFFFKMYKKKNYLSQDGPLHSKKRQTLEQGWAFGNFKICKYLCANLRNSLNIAIIGTRKKICESMNGEIKSTFFLTFFKCQSGDTWLLWLNESCVYKRVARNWT